MVIVLMRRCSWRGGATWRHLPVLPPAGWTLSLPFFLRRTGDRELAADRSLKIEVEYVRFIDGLPESTPVGTVTVREPPGTDAAPLPRRPQRRVVPSRTP
jgi:hypothetical protein